MASQQLRRLEVRDVRIIEVPGKAFDVQFDLDWREAFRDGEHWNAAWVFIKVNLAETVEVETEAAAVASLTTEHAQPMPEMLAKVQADVARGLSAIGRARPERPPGRPPLPAFARVIKSAVDKKLAEGVPLQQTDDDDALAPEPKPRTPTHAERDHRRPIHAFRLLHRRVVDNGQQVEISDDFAFLTPGKSGQTNQVTRFTQWQHLKVTSDADLHRPPNGYRGGSWYTKTSSGRVADRCFGSGLIGYAERSHDTGIRGVRTAPEHEHEPKPRTGTQ